MARHGTKSIAIFQVVSILTLLLIFVPIISNLTIQSSAASEKEANLPKWNKGDSWKYRREQPQGNMTTRVFYYLNITSENADITIDGEEHESYEATYNFQYRLTTEKHYHEKETLHETLFTTQDGKTLFYKPSWKRFDFPIKEGKTWEVHVTQYEKATGNSTAKMDLKYVCNGRETINTPAGDFLTYRINRTDLNDDTSYVRIFYSPEVKNFVKKEYVQQNMLVGTDLLADYDVEKDDNEDSIPNLGVPFFTMILALSSTIFYYKKKNR